MATQQDTSASIPEETLPGGFRTQEMLLNIGPQHPSTHGVMRLVLTLEGETVVQCTPIIGYLHRGIEKILENRPYIGGIRYLDNADYVSPMLCEIAYAGAVEQLMVWSHHDAPNLYACWSARCNASPVTWSRSAPICWTWEQSPRSCGPSATARASWPCLKR